MRPPSDHMMDLLRVLVRDEARALEDNPNADAYERGYHPGPSTGNTAVALVKRGLAEWAYRQHGYMRRLVITDAGRAELQSPVAN